MTMGPALRRLALTAHVTFSVGWLGAVAAFLALSIAGLTSEDINLVRATYPAMAVITWYVIVPLSLGSFFSGLVQSLGTKWGLFRHYWVVAKLAITVVATAILLLHTRPIDFIAESAGKKAFAGAHLQRLRIQLVADASAALVALLTATALTVHKPRGLTPHGRRQQNEAEVASRST